MLCSREATRIEITSARKPSETYASDFQSNIPHEFGPRIYDRIEVETRNDGETRMIRNETLRGSGEPRRTSEAKAGVGGTAVRREAC
jgi:hypothetical protein